MTTARPAPPPAVGTSALVGRARTPIAWLFDLDGVLTDTAAVHAAAWKATFDPLLAGPLAAVASGADAAVASGADAAVASGADAAVQRPFDAVADYVRYVDGKPHADGVRDFLRSRGIDLPDGDPSDPPDALTIAAISTAKNADYLQRLRARPPVVFPGSVALLAVLHHLGRRLAVVSASENCHTVLQVAGLAGHFAVEVDGVAAKTHQLRGKPAPDTYLFAARQLAVAPADAAVVEDAPAGVAAGRAGAFGLVVGVARRASPAELLDHGADLVVGDLDELLAPGAPTPTPAPERAERAEREERP